MKIASLLPSSTEIACAPGRRDKIQYFNRPGPRLVESLERLAEILHPGHFSFAHEGSGWIRDAG